MSEAQAVKSALSAQGPATFGAADDFAAFSPVENDAPLRWWRRLRIVPAHTLGTGRRAVLLALVAWVPIAAWALANGRAFGGDGEPLLVHYGIHVRCLIVIPLLVLAELPLHFIGRTTAARFVAIGVVTDALRADFDRVLDAVVRLRDASLPWVFAFGTAVAWTIADPPAEHGDGLSWAMRDDGSLGFGGVWFAYVSRPILIALLVGWIWRLWLVTYWMWRVGRLDLALTPAHPDRGGGIAFVCNIPAGFALVTLALSAMFASTWAHQILHHGAALASYQLTALAYVLGWSLLLLAPLLAIAPALWATRWQALPRYAALAEAQARLVDRRWIHKQETADDPLLEPQGLGVMTDLGAVYETVARMRWLPVGKETLAAIALPMAIPFVLLALASMPLGQVVSSLLSVLK
jgi:hypothetical protein